MGLGLIFFGYISIFGDTNPYIEANITILPPFFILFATPLISKKEPVKLI